MSFYESSDFRPDRSIGYLVRVINRAAVSRLEPIIEAEGISYIQWHVLVSIFFHRALTCASLARDLGHDKGAMTRVVDGLEERGLVRRERNPDDRRVLDLALTEAGHEVALRGKARVVECWNGWLEGWDHGEVEALIGALGRLRGSIEAAPEQCA